MWLIPSDLTKEQFGRLVNNVCVKRGLGASVAKIHVFDEPHKRYNKATQARERHKHLVFKMGAGFAHLQLRKDLAAHGVYGHFSFNLVGYVAYLRYCLTPSAKKLPADIDQFPWSWPATPTSSLLDLCAQSTPQMDSRNGVRAARGRKRKVMTFSEVTDAFVEGEVKTEQDAWMLAKSRKVAGDDTLFNTLGSERCVRTLVAKVRAAWHCETMATGTLLTQPDYGLDAFVPLKTVNAALPAWVQGGWRKKTLFLSGDAGLGKTEFACAIMHAMAPSKVFHFVNRVDRIRDVTFAPGEGLVVDEAYLGGQPGRRRKSHHRRGEDARRGVPEQRRMHPARHAAYFFFPQIGNGRIFGLATRWLAPMPKPSGAVRCGSQ